MMSKAGSRLLEAAKEAAAIARGDAKPAHTYIPSDINVKAIRQKLKLSQDDFAGQFGFTVNQIRDWEQGRSRPLGGVRMYLMLIAKDADGVRKLLDVNFREAA